MASLFSNLEIAAGSTFDNAVDTALDYGLGKLNKTVNNWLYSSSSPRYYFRYKKGSFVQILVNSALQQIATSAKDELLKAAKNALETQRKTEYKNTIVDSRQKDLTNTADTQQRNYGIMYVKGIDDKDHVVICRDPYNNSCSDGLMTKIPTKNVVSYNFYQDIVDINDTFATSSQVLAKDLTFQAKYLVWYDPTAMITFSSTKNTVITPVSGRDYSRKELASNGDVKFSVSGHIFSNRAELFPSAEVKKFIQVMNYKGLVEINNILLDQFNIQKILILDYTLTPIEGSKSHVNYSFNAIGIQPKSEIQVDTDTLYLDSIIADTRTTTQTDAFTTWLKEKAKKTASSLLDTADTIATAAIGSSDIQ